MFLSQNLSFPLSVSFNQCSTLASIFILLLSEREACEVCGHWNTLEHSSTRSGICWYWIEKYFRIPYLHGLAIDLLSNGMWGCGMDSSGLRYGSLAACCEYGNEPSGLTKTARVMSSWYCGPSSVQSVGRVCHLLTGLCHWPLPELIARATESCSMFPGCNVIAEHFSAGLIQYVMSC